MRDREVIFAPAREFSSSDPQDNHLARIRGRYRVVRIVPNSKISFNYEYGCFCYTYHVVKP
jgi:hypothetical protein